MMYRYDSHGQDSQMNHRTGQTVEVIRPLTEDEADLFDVGSMYKVRFPDGFETSAFADELKPSDCSCSAPESICPACRALGTFASEVG